MDFKVVTFHVSPYSEDIVDVLTAAMGEIGYDSFTQTEDGFLTSIKENLFDEEAIKNMSVLDFLKQNFQITYTLSTEQDKDWNAEWEKNFTPILVKDKILVRAGFHETVPGIEYEIIIEPKMSFGTGHHATTALMLESIYDSADKIKGEEVLDMGCGTGILGIMAVKVGAKSVVGIDIDEWAYTNAMENIKRNDLDNVLIKIGDASLLEAEGTFGVVLANINRNILLSDMQYYIPHLRKGGIMIISGFYEKDIPMLREKAETLGLTYCSYKEQNEWVAVTFCK